MQVYFKFQKDENVGFGGRPRVAVLADDEQGAIFFILSPPHPKKSRTATAAKFNFVNIFILSFSSYCIFVVFIYFYFFTQARFWLLYNSKLKPSPL